MKELIKALKEAEAQARQEVPFKFFDWVARNKAEELIEYYKGQRFVEKIGMCINCLQNITQCTCK